MSVVTSWPGFLTQWHTYWGGLFELPLFTKEPVPASSGDSGTVPSHRGDVYSRTTLLLSEGKERQGLPLVPPCSSLVATLRFC